MKSICVFCGSSKGKDPYHAEKAYELGALLAEMKIKLIFGGSKLGLMGQVAQGVLDNDGEVVGVIPKFLARKEVAHDGLKQLILVKTMHERKMTMSELADGFIALPGGFGTLEELCEILTWAQLQLITAPVGVLNLKGYYDNLDQLLRRMLDEEFLKPANYDLLIHEDEPKYLIQRMMLYEPPKESFWSKLDLT